jgi:outer membrane receptor protein involved in Fe transport
VAAQQARTGSLTGRITDERDGLIVGAQVTLTASDGTQKSTLTNAQGLYTVAALPAGKYLLRVSAKGFAAAAQTVDVMAGERSTHNIQLSIVLEEEKVTITDEKSLNVDAASNADALTLRDKDLDILPDDPEALAAALQAMAGPSAGPDGGAIYIDGLSANRLPPKESIREVRVNQNPFNAENDRMGSGRIDIATRPGMDKFRGSSFFNFSDESLNSRNPFVPERAPFQVRYFGGSFSGPLVAKRASFFADAQYRSVDDNAIINATVLDPSLRVTPFRLTLLTPNRNVSVSPRFDFQLNPNNTMVARYSYSHTAAENVGASDFSLPERAYDRSNTDQVLQLLETAVLSPTMINDTRFQYLHSRALQNGNNSIPTFAVQDAFVSGGSQIGRAEVREDRWELQNFSTLTTGLHVVRFGARVRGVHLTDVSPQNFGGTFVFAGGMAPQLDANNQLVLDTNGNPVLAAVTSLERYRRTLLFEGRSDMRALGGGVTQFSLATGNPEARVSQTDLGLYAQDEWRVRPNLTLTLGLRYERQTHISSNLNFAPRFSVAWAPHAGGGTAAAPKMVIRAGAGVFYDRLSERVALLTERFNGSNQTDFRVFNPALLDGVTFSLNGATNVPTAASLGSFASPQIVRTVANNFQTPTLVMAAINFERQLPYKFTLVAVVFNYSGRHLLRLRNINAPLPGTFDPVFPENSIRPFATNDDLYFYESSGNFHDTRFFLALRRQVSRGITLFTQFGIGKGVADTECAFGALVACFPANSYDLHGEYARASFIPKRNFVLGSNVTIPKLKLALNAFVYAASARPFDIVTGRDTNGDGLFTERPALATSNTAAADLVSTRFGDFDLNPQPGQPIIGRNLGTGPPFFSVNLGINRSFRFGPAPHTPSLTTTPSGQSSPTRPAGSAPEKPYDLTLGVYVQNLFNRTNLGQPIGNLSSPRFGESTAIAGSFGPGQTVIGSGGNRRIQLQLRLNF